MKIILDDTNPGDARLMQVLGAVMTQQAQQAAQAKRPAPEEPVAPQKSVVAAVPDEDPEVIEDPEDIINPALIDETPEVDADGVEWDEELHASTKTKTADGRWKKRRGTAKAAAPAERTTEEKAPAEEATIEQFREAVVTHKGKFGIDRTKEMLVNVAGVNTPSEVPREQWAEIIEALNSDTGAASNDINLDDFC